MNWYKTSSMNDKFSGNCGMYAIALGKIAQEEQKPVTMIVASNADNSDDLWGDVKIYHIAAEIDGQIQDGGGHTSLQEISDFSYSIYGDPNPKFEFLDLNDAFIDLSRQQTDWDTAWETYYQQMKNKEENNNIGDDNLL